MRKARIYIEDTIHELVHKVSWPTWAELQNSSVIVLVASIIIALTVFLMDYIFGINSVAEGESGWRGILGIYYKLVSGGTAEVPAE